MGTKKSQIKHHNQVDKSRAKKIEKKEQRTLNFQITRANIKIEVTAKREYLLACTLVFIIGMLLIVFSLAYIIGASLYG